MRTVIAVTVAFVAVTAGAAHATPGQCERTIIKETRVYAQKVMQKRRWCEDANLFSGGALGDCSEDGFFVTFKIASLKAKFRKHVEAACRNETLASIGWDIGRCPNFEGGTCSNPIGSVNDIPDCILCINEAADSQALSLYYDGLTVPPPTGLRACQRQIGASSSSFFSDKLKALTRCELRDLSGNLPGPCSADPKTQQTIEALEQKTTSILCSRCGGPDNHCGGGDDPTTTDIGFTSTCPDVTIPGGPPCGRPVASLSDLVSCVTCVTEFKVDCLSALVAPTLMPYPTECQEVPCGTTTCPAGQVCCNPLMNICAFPGHMCVQ